MKTISFVIVKKRKKTNKQYVGYLGRRFEFFQRRFAPEGVPTQINSVPSRSRRALFGTLLVDPPYTPP